MAESSSRTTLTSLIGLGVLMQVAGGVALVLSQLGEDDPPAGLVVAAYVLLAIGGAQVFTGLVGWGALLALRAHADEQA